MSGIIDSEDIIKYNDLIPFQSVYRAFFKSSKGYSCTVKGLPFKMFATIINIIAENIPVPVYKINKNKMDITRELREMDIDSEYSKYISLCGAGTYTIKITELDESSAKNLLMELLRKTE